MSLADELAARLPAGTALEFGELRLSRLDDGRFEARHRDDADTAGGLEGIDSVRDLRDLAKSDADGGYRPLKTAPGLKRGWRTETGCPREFLARLDAIYPGLFAAWAAYAKGELPPVPLRRTLGRQTGMYRLANTIDDAMAERLRRELCDAGCLRQIAWPIDEGDPAETITAETGHLPLLWTEACTFAVSRARELAKVARSVSHGSRVTSAEKSTPHDP